MATVNQELVKRAIRHATLLERYKKGQARKVAEFLRSSVLPRVDKIAKDTVRGTMTAKQRRAMAQEVTVFLTEAMDSLGLRMTKEMKKLSVLEASWQRQMFTESVPVDISFGLPSIRTLNAIVDGPMLGNETIKSLFDSVAKRTGQRIWKEVGIGVASGESTGDIVSRVAAVGSMTTQDATSVVRTTINAVSSQARESTFEENADLIKGVQVVATLDLRTTELCMSLDGKVFPVGEGPRPPFHWNCRTTVIPVLKSWKEMGIDRPETAHERASMDGAVPDRMTYGDWLKEQSADRQDEALGPVRAELFRKGLVDVDSFVDKSGKLLTLEQLAKAEGIEAELAEARRR